jgi:hypothetical protein
VRRASILFIVAAALWPAAAARAEAFVLDGPRGPARAITAVVTDEGPHVSIPVTLGPGRVCFSVRVGDVMGESAAPATITADGSNGSAQAG